MDYRKATPEDLHQLWDRAIAEHPGDHRYPRWKTQFLEDNQSGAAVTFVIADGKTCVGEATLLLSPLCRAIRGRSCLCDGKKTANINALRIQKPYEGKGYVSELMHVVEAYAQSIGIRKLTIGVEASEARNLGIYLHWGYTQYRMHEIEDDTLILYYAKQIG